MRPCRFLPLPLGFANAVNISSLTLAKTSGGAGGARRLGISPEREGNAIALATTPDLGRAWSRAPRTLLDASGLAVGLPEGQMGNSEVGHLNLGAGRVVMQDLVRIDESIRDGSFFANPVFVDACDAAKKPAARVHLMGLIGNGGVHAIDKHLFALIDLCAERERAARRDPCAARRPRHDAALRRSATCSSCSTTRKGRAVVASLGGRYFGMDRDKRWDRTEKWYRVGGARRRAARDAIPLEVIRAAYERNETDEFIMPTVIVDETDEPVAPMRDGDVADLLQLPRRTACARSCAR